MDTIVKVVLAIFVLFILCWVYLLIEFTGQVARLDDKFESSYTKYHKEYRGSKPIAIQIEAISNIFDLDPKQAIEYAKNLPQLPEGAEGWFAIPAVNAITAKHFPKVTDSAGKYCQAVRLVTAKFSLAPYNCRNEQITPAELRVHARTARALGFITETQKGDILIVAAQFGMRHRGKSVYEARKAFLNNEFGLGAFAVGAMLLTHPERLVGYWGELSIDCPGDEFASGYSDGDFSRSFYFHFIGGGMIKFDAKYFGAPKDNFGSASAFLPQEG